MQHAGKLETCPFHGPYFIKRLQWNSSYESITNMAPYQKTSTMMPIHQSLFHPKPHSNVINQKYIQSASIIHMTITIKGIIPMNPLPL